jgi:hypothetical protein
MTMFVFPYERSVKEVPTTTVFPSASCSTSSTAPPPREKAAVPKSIPRFPSRLKLGSRSPGAALDGAAFSMSASAAAASTSRTLSIDTRTSLELTRQP